MPPDTKQIQPTPPVSAPEARHRTHEAPAKPATRETKASSDPYFGQIDALRAFAVLIVIWQHAGHGAPVVSFGVHGVGVYGVWLFFVLSGFLITGILLRSRDRMAAGKTTLGRSLKTFYIRRFLRIFPVYYLLLAVVGTFALVPGFREYMVWHALYITNWLIAIKQSWPHAAGPLWSLAVEEQFYLFWPLVVLLTPRQHLKKVLIGTIITALVWRAGITVVAWTAIRTLTPTPGNLDTLGIGALLAWHRHANPDAVATRDRWTRLALFAGLALIAVTFVLSRMDQGIRLFSLTESLSAALVSVWLINGAVTGFRGLGGRLLTFAPLLYIGRISYGVYLIHDVISWGIRRWPIASPISALAPENGVVYFFVVTLATIAVASISWFAFEKPLNDLKHRVPY